MIIDGWRYYNHAVIPTTAPHEKLNLAPVESGLIWENRNVLLARYTTDFDCGYETNWWYVIQDKQFDISQINAKRRYEINKGNKNFDVRVINPSEYSEALFSITKASYESWPEKYRPTIDIKKWDVSTWNNAYRVYGAFSKQDATLHGYACLKMHEKYIDFTMLRVEPSMERLAINAAMVHGILTDNANFIAQGGYICDGERSISHETAFQDYLEKYFIFRKAYCKLHITYNSKVKWIIKLIYPFRKLLKKLDGMGLAHQINAILKMEEIVRQEKKDGAIDFDNNAII